MINYIMKITHPMKSHYIKSPPSKEIMNMSCLRQSTIKHFIEYSVIIPYKHYT